MKIQLESGPSSSATHSLTQPSTTLNRRYVSRPTTLAIEEAAQAARRREIEESTMSAPSRLVNLRLRETDIIASHVEQQDESPLEPEPDYAAIPEQPEEISEYALPEADDQMSVIRNQIAAELAETTPIEPVPISEPAPDISHAISDANYDANHPYDAETSTLALSIAADYTAASLGAATSTSSDRLEETDKLSAAIYAARNTNPIDQVAQAATSAITAVRTATTPEEIADRLEALRQFADQIKQDTSIPEMSELSNTLQNFISIAEKSTGIKAAAKLNRAANKAEKSTAKIIKSAPTTTKANTPATTHKVVLGHTVAKRPVARPAMSTASPRRQKRTTTSRPASRASHNNSIRQEEETLRRAMRSVATSNSNTKAAHRAVHRKGRIKRFILAFSVSAASVIAIAYFVTTNIPDISVRVAAMQTGVEASYPSYIPSDFSLEGIDSGDGKITLTFKTANGKSFSLIEEKSSWDSAALQRNYVQETWKDNYTTTHEQGITIFINEASAAWVNGGVLYKINADPGILTKKQLRNIVTSM